MPDLKVQCNMKDCLFFRRHGEDPRGTYCAHGEKYLYMNGACPLYKKQFDVSKEQQLRERFLKRPK